MTTYRVLSLTDTAAANGRLLAQSLQLAPSAFRRNPWEDDLGFLRSCAALVRSLHPGLWDEIAAFAEALGLPPERGLFIRAAQLPQGCSVLAWRSITGHVLVGRNYDYYVHMPTRHLLHTATSYGYAHLGMNGGLVGGRYDGVNEHGLFIGLHKVMADRTPFYEPGVPYHLMPRLALDLCRSTMEALAFFRTIPQLSAFNYTLADKQGDFARVECYPGLPSAILQTHDLVATTNHFDTPALAAKIGRRPVRDSQARAAHLCAAVAYERGDPWVQTAQALADHATPLCCHKEFGTTLWSGLYDLTAERVAYAFGPPCSTPYREYAWPGTEQPVAALF